MSGRPPVPTQLKMLNGTTNPTRANEREPQLPAHVPDPPPHLNDEERAAWAMFADLLEPMRVVTEADSPAFEMLAVTFVHHQRLAAALREAKSLVYVSKWSDRLDPTTMKPMPELLRQRPELGALADVARRLLVLLGRFGLTPADRTKVVQLSDAGGDPFDEFA